jgi:site-specific DNA recombinase
MNGMIARKFKFRHCLCYLRKSRKDEEYERRTGEDVLQSQDTLMRSVLNPMKIKYTVKKEIGSGKNIDSRPIFDQGLNDIENGIYDCIAVKEIARLSRGSYADMGRIYDLIKEYNIFIITPSRIFDPRNEADLTQLRFELFFAKEEYEKIKSRLNGAKITKAKEGKWMTAGVPYGYEIHPITKRLVLSLNTDKKAEKAEIVKLIFNLYVHERYGYKQIQNTLKAMEIKSPKGKKLFDETTISAMLENEAYIGVAHYQRTKTNSKGKRVDREADEQIRVENAHEPIIAKEIFEQAQLIRKEKGRLPKNANFANQHDSSSYEIKELSGLMVCSTCGRNMRIATRGRTTKSGEKVLNKIIECKNGCNSVKFEVGLEYVEGLLGYMGSMDGKKIEHFLSEFKMIKNETEKAYEEHLDEIEATLKEREVDLQEQLKELQIAKLRKEFTFEEYVYHKERIESDLQALREMNVTKEISATKEKQNFDVYISVLEKYKNAKTPELKNKILSAVFDHIELEVLERGTKSKQAKCKLTPAFNYLIELPEAN